MEVFGCSPRQLRSTFAIDYSNAPRLHVYPDWGFQSRLARVRIAEPDWVVVMGHINAILDHFDLAGNGQKNVISFVAITRNDIVEA